VPRAHRGVIEAVGGGCILCTQPDFQRVGFGPRTVILCDQCEREFHVGCLHATGRAQLTELPDGDWFCSAECGAISETLRAAAAAGNTSLTADHSWQLLRVRSHGCLSVGSLPVLRSGACAP
jgi:PHD-finger